MKLPDIHPERITTLEEARNVIEQLVEIIRAQQQIITELTREIARLKGHPKRPTFPPSRSSHAVTPLLKEKKVWHKRSKGQIPIDRHVALPSVIACVCGGREFSVLRTTQKIIQGMSIQRTNTAYHGKDLQCLHCGKVFPQHIPADIAGTAFGPEFRSLLSFLKYGCRITEPLLLKFCAGFGVAISAGEIDAILLRNGHRLTPAYRHLKRVGFTRSAFLQTDATGSKRRDEKTRTVIHQHLHLFGTPLFSVFAITGRYTQAAVKRLLGKTGWTKPFVSDDGSANGDGLDGRVKQLCWVHELRRYRKLEPVFSLHRKAVDRVLEDFKRLYRLAKAYGPDPTPKKRQKIELLFTAITITDTGYWRLNRQMRATLKKRSRLLAFLDHPELPIHNNTMEQGLREAVVQRTISHETKSQAGDQSLVHHLSILQTAQKQGLDVFATLHGLLTGTLFPTVLTANIC